MRSKLIYHVLVHYVDMYVGKWCIVLLRHSPSELRVSKAEIGVAT
jgi:hypothetical protein